VLQNHLHIVIRTHRDRSETMLDNFASATLEALHDCQLVPAGHPVWSDRSYKVFLKTRDAVRTRIDYVKRNPRKEGIAEQNWDFVVPFEL
jgi:hypothetical protein